MPPNPHHRRQIFHHHGGRYYGEYVMILTVGKALTQGNNPASVETWVSPVFRIERSGAGGGAGEAGE